MGGGIQEKQMGNRQKSVGAKGCYLKKLTAITLPLLIGGLLFCQDYRNPPKMQVSIQPGLGYQAGSIGEHLFNMGGIGKPVAFAPDGGRQISFLQWDIHGMMVARLDVDFRYRSFYIKLHGEAGLPLSSGKMDDFDWNTTKDHQTHFSTHHNRVSDHFSAGGLLGWILSSTDGRLQCTPMAGWSWQQTSMTASDGYYQYVPSKLQETRPWTDNLPKEYLNGDVINYRHEVFQIDLLLRLTYHHNPRLSLSLEGSIHPVIGVFGYDTHLLRDLQFLDYNMTGQLAFGTALMLGYQIIPQHWLTLKVDYNYLPVVTGPAYSKSTSQRYYYPSATSKGGASHWFVGVSLGWKFNLFQRQERISPILNR